MAHALAIDLIDARFCIELQALTQALLGDFVEIRHRGMAFRDGKARHLIAAEDVVVLHLLSNRDRVVEGLLHHLSGEVINEESLHLLATLDVFGSGVPQPFLIAEQLARQDAQQGVVGFDVIATEVVGVVGGNQLDAQLLGESQQAGVDDAIFR